MNPVLAFKQFMDAHRCGRDQVLTHTGMHGTCKGRYSIPDEDFDRFCALYANAVFDGNQVLHLVERPTKFGPARIDIDFRFRAELHPERKYTDAHIETLVGFYQEVFRTYMVDDTPDQSLFHAYVFERARPYVNKNGGVNDGIHIVFPNMVCDPPFFLFTRDAVMAKIRESGLFADLELTNRTADAVDRSVIDKNGWMVYGSCKPGGTPYSLTKMFLADGSLGALPEDPKPMVKQFTIRRPPSAVLTKFTDEQAWRTSWMALNPDLAGRFCGGGGGGAANGRTSPRSGGGSSSNASRTRPMAMSRTTPRGGMTNGRPAIPQDEFDEVSTLVAMLHSDRADGYETWWKVGMLLFNITPTGITRLDDTYLPLWIQFSKLSRKYQRGVCTKVWKTMRRRGNGLGMGSLHWWAKIDSPDMYLEYQQKKLNPLLRASVSTKMSGQSYDVACVIRELYKHDHVCASVDHMLWYYFKDGRWRKSQKAISLRLEISEEVFSQYCRLASYLNRSAAETGSEEGNDSRDELLRQAKMANDVAKKLRTLKFKNDVIREAADLLFNPEFLDLLDSKGNILAFNDGMVVDLDMIGTEQNPVRHGCPEDYVYKHLSVSHAEYDPDSADAKLIAKTFREIYPNPDTREYMYQFFASSLDGRVWEPLFTILLGIGSNGKSLVTDMVEHCMGSLFTRMPVALITQKRAASNAATPELARAAGSRLLSFAEAGSDEKLSVSLIKELTSDTFVCRELYSAPRTVTPSFSLMLASNFLPAITGSSGAGVDYGVFRRVRVVKHVNTFKVHPKGENELPIDEGLLDKLKKCAEQFIATLLFKYRDYKKNNHRLPVSSEVMAATNEYQKASDVYQCFLGDLYSIYPKDAFPGTIEDAAPLDSIWFNFRVFFRDNYSDRKLPSKQELKKYLKNTMYKSRLIKGKDIYAFRLKSDEEENSEEKSIGKANDNAPKSMTVQF